MAMVIGSEPVLVLGGNGKTGGRVAARLREQGLPVRLGSRSAEIPFDWAAPRTWAGALDGIKSVYASFQPDLAVPGALETVELFFVAACRAGVEKLVLLSGRGEPEAQDAEEVLRSMPLDWTILRASWFNQNFSENFLVDGLRQGEVVLPSGLAPEPFVDADDIAEVAVASLLDRRHSNRLYELTGPSAVSFADAVSMISAATDRELQYIEVPPEAYRAALGDAGLPEAEIALLMYLFTTVLDGRNVMPADGVRTALGRDAKPFASYVAQTAATGIWNGSDD